MWRGEGPTKEWDRLWMTCGSPPADDDVEGDGWLLLGWWGVKGPKTSVKSNSVEPDEEEGGVIVSFLRLAAKREWRPFCDVDTMFEERDARR